MVGIEITTALVTSLVAFILGVCIGVALGYIFWADKHKVDGPINESK